MRSHTMKGLRNAKYRFVVSRRLVVHVLPSSRRPLSLSRRCRQGYLNRTAQVLSRANMTNGQDPHPNVPSRLKAFSKVQGRRLLEAVKDWSRRSSLAVYRALLFIWRTRGSWLRHWLVKSLIAWAVSLGAITALVNVWIVPALNRRIPALSASIATSLEREVELGAIRWLAPTGISGLHPFASVGPVRVGPSSGVEQSEATLESVTVGIDPLRSIANARIVVTARAGGAEIHLRQTSNYSWFGFPEDTKPSSRNFFPGIQGSSGVQKTNPQNESLGLMSQLANQLLEWKDPNGRQCVDAPDLGDCLLFDINSGPKIRAAASSKHPSIEELWNSRRIEAVDDNQQQEAVSQPGSPSSLNKHTERLAKQLAALNSISITSPTLQVPTAAQPLSSSPSSSLPQNHQEESKSYSLSSEAINRLKPLSRKTGTEKIRIKPTAFADAFHEAVVDLATVRRRQLGSKALQRARNWTPVQSQDRPSELSTAIGASQQHVLGREQRSQENSIAVDGNGDGHMQASSVLQNWTLNPKTTLSPKGKEESLLSMNSAGPFYTPAPPAASNTSKRRKLFDIASLRQLPIVQAATKATISHLQSSVMLGCLTVEDATLFGYIHGEQVPRVFENLSARLSFQSRNYDDLQVDISAHPRMRDPETYKCTMLTPKSQRHLRNLCIPEDSDDVQPNVDERQDGGRVSVTVRASGIVSSVAPNMPNLMVSIRGEGLHAPLIERIVELPMDITGGRIPEGELIIRAHDTATWRFPEFYGRVKVRNADFHFWDAVDDIMAADLDLLFERDRLYLCHAHGYFGAVEMSVTGDLDLDPLKPAEPGKVGGCGRYRLMATVPGVEANALRATLGVRPTPFPVAGTVRGTLYVTGPLEKPVFSGHATVHRPVETAVCAYHDAQGTTASEALQRETQAVGAYDRVPFKSASLVFSLDTATEIMTLHEAMAEPIEGGCLRGNGTLKVSPSAEMDPDALSINVTGTNLPVDGLAGPYLVVVADGHDQKLPPQLALGGAASIQASLRGAHLAPIIDVSFTVPESMARGTMQFTRETTLFTLSSPNIDVDGSIALRPPSFAAIKSALTQAEATKLAQPDIVSCDADVSLKGLDVVPLLESPSGDGVVLRQLARQPGEPVRLRVNGRARIGGNFVNADFSMEKIFDGKFDLENVKLNQLGLYRALKGSFKLGPDGIAVQARGVRPDEALDVNIALPLPNVLNATEAANATSSTHGAPPTQSSISLRCGQLALAATMDGSGSQVDFKVANLHLDELELASLRGDLQEVSCSLNFKSQTGRGRLSVVGPRYSGFGGESLSGGVRWERDVLRLEKLALQQKQSRYEVQGEYVFPPQVRLPTTAAEFAAVDTKNRKLVEFSGQNSGRWRLRMDVPLAEIQELLPIARLLQNAVTPHGPFDYERAKASFIDTVKDVWLRAQDLNGQVMEIMGGRRVGAYSDGAEGSLALSNPGTFRVPVLQDCRGQWNGSIQAFGGGGGATSCEFDVKGHDWQWGPSQEQRMDTVVGKGGYHSEEGVHLQEFMLKAGDAKLLVRGSLLNDNQNATVLITDFPMVKLNPLFRAIPALKHTAPAAAPKDPEPIPSPLPLGMLANALQSAGTARGFQNMSTDSPINGLLYVSGTLGGSQHAPTGEIAVRLYDAAVGPTRLSQAQASARVMENGQLSFTVDVVPVEGHRKSGHIRASGTIPLTQRYQVQDVKEEMDVRISIRDGGMAVLTSVTPDLTWQSGEADASFRLTGDVAAPTVVGRALLNKAIIDCPFLKSPLTIVAADIKCQEDGMLDVQTLDARAGRRGHLRARGVLPMYRAKDQAGFSQHRLSIDVQNMEMRVRNLYNGQLDALLTVRDSVEQPVIGGSVRLSRGALYLMPQGQEQPVTQNSVAGPSVAEVFDLLTTHHESGFAAQLEDAVRQEVQAVEHLVEEAAGPDVVLDALGVQFGPDLRALYPLVMNFAVSGDLVVSGAAHPEKLIVDGTMRLLSGEVNLVAAQLELERDHANVLTFVSGSGSLPGVDPLVDLVLKSGELQVAVRGRASEWADHVVMQMVGGKGGQAVTHDQPDQLDASEAARLLESKLKGALLAENGQLALSRLAGSTVSTLLPKIESQGNVAGARWRLVSAPAIPGLLDPLMGDPSNLLGSITMGTEVEVQFGRKLQAAMVRKLHDSDVTTQWTLNYNLNSNLRMQFNISSALPYSKTLTFQYSSEGNR